MDINQVKEFAGRVIAVNYPRFETPDEESVMAWRVLYVDAGDLGHVGVSGKIGWRPKPREELRFWGKFELYRGKPTFRFTRAAYEIPVNERGMLHQACMMATGVGEATEEAIWNALGENWREVTRDDVRISESALANLHEAIEGLKLNAARAEAVAFLLDCGCTDAMAASAFERWGANTISKVHADPYCLCALRHYGFRDVDTRIAPRFGMTRSDPRRIQAAIRHALASLTDSATVVYWQVLCDEILKAVPDAGHGAIERTVRALVSTGAIQTFSAESPANPKLTTRRLYDAEKSIVDYAVASLQAHDEGRVEINLANMDVALDDSQLRAIMAACERRFLIINGGAGSGKCLGRGTPVIMYDMTFKAVEDIRTGDVLLGPDGKPKHVTSITSGWEEMFRITPNSGDAFTCNRSHILSVIHSRKKIREYTSDAKQPFNISVNDILTKLKPEHAAHLKCWRPDCIEREERAIQLDPYFLGVWLGDGSASKGVVRIANSDKEVIDWLLTFAEKNGLVGRVRPGYFAHTCPIIEIVSPLGRVKGSNPIKKVLSRLDLFDNKHIPLDYLDNDRHVRLSLLAGLLDSDGYYAGGEYEITQKSEQLAKDITFLARSLGFWATVKPCRKQCGNNGVWGDYYRVIINGDLNTIPCIVPRKRAQPRKQIKNPRVSGIKIESIGEGEYFGFTLAEDDGLFLLGDFTVTHNTTIIRAIADTLGAPNVEICAFAGKAAARLRERTGHAARTIHSMLGYKGETLGFRRPDLNGKTVILDEASMVNSELLAEITKRTPARLILVGDEAQLPPVGSGAPFHDLIRLMPETVRTLATCYRNSEAIYKAALAVRNSRMPALKEQTAGEFWQFAQTGNDIATHRQILQLVREKKIDFATDLVLACRNGDGLNLRAAVASLNVDIKAIVNPPRKDDARAPLRQLDECDRVICTVNDPESDTWNGTTGTIASVDLSGGAYIELDFPTSEGKNEVYVEKAKLKNWSLAYALTVHKSQGSQYRKVFFVCLMRDTFMLLDRAMLYTAMTRAKEACYGLGQLQAFRTAINKADVKLTVIQELLS